MAKKTLLLLLFLLCLAMPSFAQQGGGMGGGGFGGRGTAVDDGTETTVHEHILTPGDRGEWPITAKEGDVVIANAESSIFDPAVEVVDAAGKVLAQNDDIEPGDQQAQLLYRFEKAGEYKLLVKGYKSAAGGRYTLTIRRFSPVDARVGDRNAGRAQKNGIRWLRFPAKAGQTMIVSASSSSLINALVVYGPDGSTVGQGDRPGALRMRDVFESSAGDHYARLYFNAPEASYAITISVAYEAKVTIGAAPAQRGLPRGGLDIWTFEGKAGDIVRVEGLGPVKSELSFRPAEGVATETSVGALHLLPAVAKKDGIVGAMLLRSGTFEVEVSQPLDMETTYTMAVKSMGRSWTPGEASGKLAMGNSDYWYFEGKRGDIVRLEGATDQFDLTLELLNAEGDRVAFNDDGGTQGNAAMTVLLPDTARYLVRVAAHGDGGSGSYSLRRSPAVIRSLVPGTMGEGTIGLGGTEIWSFSGKAGQTIAISTRSLEFDCSIRLFGPDGLEVAADDNGGEGSDSLVSVRLPLDGVYTVWVAGSGSGKYRIRWLDLDK